MNDKIKELSVQRATALFEKYKAMFVKQNADADYLEKNKHLRQNRRTIKTSHTRRSRKMTPEIEKAVQDFINSERDYKEAEQGFKEIKERLTNENLDYDKTQQKLEKLNKQHEALEMKCYKLEEQISIEEHKARKIFETLESNWDYKMAKNHLIGTKDKLDSARNYLERLIAKEVEK